MHKIEIKEEVNINVNNSYNKNKDANKNDENHQFLLKNQKIKKLKE